MIKPSVYQLGTSPPVLKTDPGAGAWNSEPASLELKALKGVLTRSAVKALASHFGGDDAVTHLSYYLSNQGGKYTVDFQGLIAEAPTARKAYEIQVAAAKGFIETLALRRKPDR